MSRLGIDPSLVARARDAASKIADEMDAFHRARSTLAIERTTLRLIGIDGVDREDIPLPNRVVDELRAQDRIEGGVLRFVASAMAKTGRNPQQIAEAVAEGQLTPGDVPDAEEERIEEIGEELAGVAMARFEQTVAARNTRLANSAERQKPWHYVIVATGNIYEDVVQAETAAIQGADIIAVIRSTGQSLLDYVPYGATTEGFGGTYATQENFRIMRAALDEVGDELGRYIRLCNYCSGLCMPEIAAMGAIERLDMMLNDALYGILFRDINPQRTFVDQYYSRMINAAAQIIINTGEDNYLTTADAVEAAHTVTASQFINEQFAQRSGVPPALMGLGHAMEIDPRIEDGFLMELAQAELARELFPEAPLKFMPPTKFMTGNIFRGHIQDALFNLVGVWSRQGIQLLGMMTEAMHTPHMHDRRLALENAQYVMNNARGLAEEIEYKSGGKIQLRARSVLQEAVELLERVAESGIFAALEKGIFADVFRPKDRGRGLDGVFARNVMYFNPIETHLRQRLGLDAT